MPQVARIAFDNFSQGYNSRDDGRKLGPGQCQRLVNAYPGEPPRPREGVSRWNQAGWPSAPRAQFAWRDARGDKVLAVIGRDLWWIRRGGDAAQCAAAELFPSETCAVSFERFLEWGILLTDRAGFAFVLEWRDNQFDARRANIEPPAGEVLEGHQATGGAIPANTWRLYGLTWINRDAETPALVEEGYTDGLLESCELRDQRALVHIDATHNAAALTITAKPADPQVTHARLWASISAPTATEAEGLALRWLADIPVPGAGPWTYLDRTSDGNRRGELNLLQTTGLNAIPPGRFLKYHAGLLWVGGAQAGESPGRFYYSQPIQNAQRPLKFLSLFNETYNIVDVATDESAPATALGVSRNDLYFFCGTRYVHRLRNGDIQNATEQLTGQLGLAMPGSLTEINQDLHYLSPEGPVALSGGVIEPFPAFTAGEVWPKTVEGPGYFHQVDPATVRGFWYRSTWWITDGLKTVGFHVAPDGQSRGPLEVVLGDAALRLDNPCVLSEDQAVFSSGEKLFWFLHPGVRSDNYSLMTVALRTRKMLLNPKRPYQVGELYDCRLHARWSDAGALKIVLQGDDFRFAKAFTYAQRGPECPLQNAASSNTFRHSVQQAIPAGFYGSQFEIEVQKVLRPPFDFLFRGGELGLIPRLGHPADWVSVAPPEDIPLDEGLLLVDDTLAL